MIKMLGIIVVQIAYKERTKIQRAFDVAAPPNKIDLLCNSVHKKITVPTFVTKVKEFLWSGWFFFHRTNFELS